MEAPQEQCEETKALRKSSKTGICSHWHFCLTQKKLLLPHQRNGLGAHRDTCHLPPGSWNSLLAGAPAPASSPEWSCPSGIQPHQPHIQVNTLVLAFGELTTTASSHLQAMDTPHSEVSFFRLWTIGGHITLRTCTSRFSSVQKYNLQAVVVRHCLGFEPN